MARPETPIGIRLWAKVDKSGKCWMWTGHIAWNGYGYITKNHSKQLLVHRVAWELLRGPIPNGKFVCHHCDNPPCVNPAHLFVGTAKDNNRDMWAKGRGYTVGGASGEAHHAAKLTEAQVRLIRNDSRTSREIATQYGMSKTTIQYIKRRKSWKCVV